MGLQIGVDIGLSKNIQKHSFKRTSQELTGILIPPPQSGDYPRNRIVGWSTVA